MHATDSKRTPFHDAAVSIEGHFLSAHCSHFLEEARLVVSGTMRESGVRRAGAEAGHGDSGTMQFVGDSLGERNNVRLRRVVDSHQRSRQESGSGSNVHDASTA